MTGSQLWMPCREQGPVLPDLLIFREKLRDLAFYVKTAEPYNLEANVWFLQTMCKPSKTSMSSGPCVSGLRPLLLTSPCGEEEQPLPWVRFRHGDRVKLWTEKRVWSFGDFLLGPEETSEFAITVIISLRTQV